ncbi:hypothetical protein G6M89_03470 [Natronolimnobius sp. AArcel1]|uniref:hypothetical protein n=1 Tax=Natronolimnobius sp. AArcel1 TaxID=1679093 RepID=UPI0013EA248E|nr:hypothetical protein [Natronolimnobius sp. AArcel1]NGM68080.1 hypothetical protein [Natronolimnobius sp. AArcel1]
MRSRDEAIDRSENPDSIVRGTEPQLSPGEEATLTIDATDVSRISFEMARSFGGIHYSFNPQEFSPPPDERDFSFSPTWYWSTPESVTVEIDVQVSHDAAPGEYQYSIEAQEADSADPVTEDFHITILED